MLLVEDDPDHVTIAQHYLRRLEGRVSGVETCSSLADAEPLIRAGEFDLVLLDLTLPDSVLESTIEAIADLSKGRPAIVAMSSLDVPEIRQRVHECGAAAFLPKTRLNAKSLNELFDQLDSPKGRGSDASGPRPSLAAAKAAIEVASPQRTDGKTLASKIAHDANSWLTNASFRIAALRQHEGTKDCSVAQSHLDSIETSLSAISSIVSGSRSVCIDELTAITVEALDLNQRLPKIVDVWRISSPKSSLTVEHSDLPKVAADEAALSNLFAIFASNALNHGPSTQETVLRMGQVPPPSEEFATLRITDDGGPWKVTNPARITDPTFRGDPSLPYPGLGLYRAKRWMERMGGSLEMVPREDSPGAYAALLNFRACV